MWFWTTRDTTSSCGAVMPNACPGVKSLPENQQRHSYTHPDTIINCKLIDGMPTRVINPIVDCMMHMNMWTMHYLTSNVCTKKSSATVCKASKASTSKRMSLIKSWAISLHKDANAVLSMMRSVEKRFWWNGGEENERLRWRVHGI